MAFIGSLVAAQTAVQIGKYNASIRQQEAAYWDKKAAAQKAGNQEEADSIQKQIESKKTQIETNEYHKKSIKNIYNVIALRSGTK